MNTIFQDQKLLAKFMEILKVGQAADPAAARSLARKLVDSLEREYGGWPDISSATTTNVSVPTLSSLHSLLKFLADNKVAVNGRRIAFTQAEYDDPAGVPEVDRAKLSTVTGETIREADNRKWDAVDYWVNISELSDYIQYLRSRAESMEQAGDPQGRLLRVMVDKLGAAVKHPEIAADVAKPAAKTTQVGTEVADTTTVDVFGSKTFDERVPLENTGVAPGKNAAELKLGDLKSRAALDEWLKKSTTWVVVYDAQGRKQAVEYGRQGVDPCPIMRVLFLRARDKQNQAAGDPAKKKVADAYLQAVQNVGALFTGLDGKPCHITLPETPKSEVADVETKTVQPGEMTRDQQQAIAQSIALLPFEQGRISFGRIKQFFNAVGTLPLPAEARSNMQQAIEAMNAATNLTTTGETTFNLDEPTEQYKYILKDPKTGQITKSWGIPFTMMLDALMKVIYHTRQVIVYFWQHYREIIGPANEKKILAQVGKTPTDYSLYLQNYTTLHRQMPIAR